MKPKLIRLTTVPISMNIILKGQLGYMNQFFEVIGVTGYDEKHFNEIAQREGIRMKAVDMARTIAPFKDLRALWQLYRFFEAEKPTIVHTHTPKAGLLGMLAAFLARIPVRMHTVGGMPLTEVKGAKRVLLNWMERLTYACAHGVYPNSKGLQEIIIAEQFCHPDKLKVLANGGSNGINTDVFKPDYIPDAAQKKVEMRQSLGIKEADIVLCFIGRIAKEKGMIELLPVFERLQQKYPIQLILVGVFEKYYGALPEILVKRIENNPDIHFLGRFDDVRPYYAMSDIFVFPSYREGFPNAVLEAGAMGLPSIVTDINGCNEIIENRKNGLIIAPKSELELEKALLALLEQPALYDSLSKQARPTIVQYFRREFVWAEMLKEYQFQINKH